MFQTVEARYIGNVKERKGGHRTAFAWVPGLDWYAIFSEQVLRAWFNMPTEPTQAPTFYATLGVAEGADDAALKSAYRKMARQWHPDVNHEQGAEEQFKAINEAYETLTKQRAKYDAGLALMRKSGWVQNNTVADQYGRVFIPPLRCGHILCEARHIWNGKKLEVLKIHAWEDITDAHGNVLVTSWRYGDDLFSETWVPQR